MPEITPAILAAADAVDHDLDALDMSTRTLLSLLRAQDTQPPGGGGGATEYGLSAFTPGTTGTYSAQVGWKFQPTADVSCTGARGYLAPSTNSNETFRLWRVSDTTLIASATTLVNFGSWVEVLWGSPVALVSTESYLITMREQAGNSRVCYNPTDAAYTVNTARLTHQGSVFAATNSYPTVFAENRIYGIPDVILAP